MQVARAERAAARAKQGLAALAEDARGGPEGENATSVLFARVCELEGMCMCTCAICLREAETLLLNLKFQQ